MYQVWDTLLEPQSNNMRLLIFFLLLSTSVFSQNIEDYYSQVPSLEDRVESVLASNEKPISIQLLKSASNYNVDASGNRFALDGFAFRYTDHLKDKVYFHRIRRDKVWGDAPPNTPVAQIPFTYKTTEYLQVMCGNGYCDYYLKGDIIDLQFGQVIEEPEEEFLFAIDVCDVTEEMVDEISNYLSERGVPFFVKPKE